MKVSLIEYKTKKSSEWQEGYYVRDFSEQILQYAIFTKDFRPVTNRHSKIYEFRILEEDFNIPYTEKDVVNMIIDGSFFKVNGIEIDFLKFVDHYISIDGHTNGILAIMIIDIVAMRIKKEDSKHSLPYSKKTEMFKVGGTSIRVKKNNLYNEITFKFRGKSYMYVYGFKVNKNKKYWFNVNKKDIRKINKLK